MKFSIWDITKSIAVIVMLVFLWVHGTALVNYIKYDSAVADTTKKKISDNAEKMINTPVSKRLVKDLIKELKRENSLLTSDEKHIEEVGRVNGKVKEKTIEESAADEVDESNDKESEHWYSHKEITAKGHNDEEVSIAWAKYFPNKDENERWAYGNYDIAAKVNIVRTENKDGKFNHSAEVNIYGKDDKKLYVEDVNIDWAIKSMEGEGWHWWNPRLGLGAVVTPGMYGPRLDISFVSYGRTEVDIDWRFLTLGIGFHNDPDGNKNAFGVFEPVSYNIGRVLPVVENIFLGANIIHDGSEVSYGIGLSVPF